jgi:hypothetical protein
MASMRRVVAIHADLHALKAGNMNVLPCRLANTYGCDRIAGQASFGEYDLVGKPRRGSCVWQHSDPVLGGILATIPVAQAC